MAEPRTIHLVVYGTPMPAGSKSAYRWKAKDGRSGVAVADANPKSRPWKNQVAQVAGEQGLGRRDAHGELVGEPLLEGPLEVMFRFYVARPKGHFKKSGGLSAKGRRTPYPAVRPDLLKLARGVEDALSGVIYRDDAQIVTELLEKRYCTPERVQITVREVGRGE